MSLAIDLPRPPLPPAPGAADHGSLALANSVATLPHEGLVEMLPTPEAATQWLVEHALAPEDVSLQDYCAGLLKGMRSHLREAFAAAVDDREPSRASVAAINQALSRTQTANLLGWDAAGGFHSESRHPTTRIVEHALGVVANDAVSLVCGPDRAALVSCEAEPCDRFFLRTHGRRLWCSTRCGSRVRAARSYARRRQT